MIAAAAAVSRPTVLFVGYRRAAVEAARRRGYRCLVLDPRGGRPRRGLAWEAAGESVEEAVAAARRLAADLLPDVIVPVTERAMGLVEDVAAELGLPPHSTGPRMVTHDKLAMKEAFRAAGVPCADFAPVDQDTDAEDLVAELGLPIVLKPRRSSGSRGVEIVENLEALERALAPGLLAEGLVRGVEMSVETIRSAGHALFRNHTRYLAPRWANVVPAGLPGPLAEEIDAVTDAALDALGIETGLSHLELFLTDAGPVVGEVAHRPPGGRIMDLIELAYGFDPWDALLQVALGSRPLFPPARTHAGVWLLHPGAGVVTAVEGLEEARALPGVESVTCRVRPGDEVTTRLGTGEAVGEIVATAADHDDCVQRLVAAKDRVTFTMAGEDR